MLYLAGDRAPNIVQVIRDLVSGGQVVRLGPGLAWTDARAAATRADAVGRQRRLGAGRRADRERDRADRGRPYIGHVPVPKRGDWNL